MAHPQWYYKGDLRLKGDDGWTPYAREESDDIERAFQDGRKVFNLNGKYRIRFDEMLQCRITDESRQRAIKREAHAVDTIHGRTVWVVVDSAADDAEICGVYVDRPLALAKKDSREAKLRARGQARGHTVSVVERRIK